MSAQLPTAAREVLDRGTLCHLAVPTAHGPHLTPVVYVFHRGRLWVTTSRSSVKAGAWRRGGTVAGLVRDGEVAVTFRGTVRTHDALDPLSWPAAVAGGPTLVAAATRFTLKNARFFAGYAVDAARVPLSWTPPGRVFAEIRLTAGWVLAVPWGPAGEGWGEWHVGGAYRASYRERRPRTPLDRRAPREVRAAVGGVGEAALALEGANGLAVLPVRWRRVAREGAYDAVLPESSLSLAAAPRTAPAALTADRASRWRAADMAGMLLQGRAELYGTSATSRGASALRARLGSRRTRGPGREGASEVPIALVRLVPERLVWWHGWTSGTVAR